MKGQIRANHIPVNKFALVVVGLPPLTPTDVSGIDIETESVELPDRTKASGGQTKPSEMTIKIPMHHSIEIAAMDTWQKQGQDPVSPLYKKSASLLMYHIGPPGLPKVKQLLGVFVTKSKYPDLEMKNEGEMAVVEYTLSIDQVM